MKNKDFNKLLLLIPAGLILVGSIVFLYSRPGSGDDRICQENVSKLQELENADIAQTEQQLQNLKKSEEDDSLRNMDSSTVLDDVQIRQAFAGSVILGDSITNSIVEYGYRCGSSQAWIKCGRS